MRTKILLAAVAAAALIVVGGGWAKSSTTTPTITLSWTNCKQKISLTTTSKSIIVALPKVTYGSDGLPTAGSWMRVLSNIRKLTGYSGLNGTASGIYTPAGNLVAANGPVTFGQSVYHVLITFPTVAHYTLNFGNSRCFIPVPGAPTQTEPNMVNATTVSLTIT